MSSLRVSQSAIITPSTATSIHQTSLILLPLLCAILPANRATAQIIPADDSTHSTVDITGSQINITDGQHSVDGANLFHSFEQFDLGSGQTASFITAPDVQNVVGQIRGQQASIIDGTLQVSGSDADLYLINPSGVLMGPDAHLNLPGSFSATSATGIHFGDEQLSIGGTNNYRALTGNPSAFHFDSEQASAVVNMGDLSVDDEASISLIGGTVVNAGSLKAPEGAITLAAVEGSNIVRIQQDNQLLSLEVEATDGVLSGKETITPTSIGQMLSGGSLSHATNLIVNADGSVQIAGSRSALSERGGETIVSGTLSATGNRGGNINVLGETISLAEAVLDASGNSGGGLLRVGGDYRGVGKLFKASQTSVDNNSRLLADALQTGDGGQVIIWADNNTAYGGHISARGSESGGDGGFAEISGKVGLSLTGSIDLSAPKGSVGTALFDPSNIVITDTTPTPPDTTTSLFLSSSEVEALSIAANVVLEATNDIIIEAIADGALTFERGRSVTFRADANNFAGGEFRMESLTDVIEVEEGNVSIFGAGITVGKLSVDPKYSDNEANDPSIGHVLLESSEWLNVGEIISERGDVTLSADEIIAGVINTSSDDHNNGGTIIDGRTRIAAGNVVLSSDGNVKVGEILTYGSLTATEHHSPDGGDVTITASGGDIEVGRKIETFSYVQGHEAGSAGDITLIAQNDIFVNTEGLSVTSLNASSIVEEYEVGDGGNVALQARQGSIEVQGSIDTSAQAKDGDSYGDAGSVELRASGNITTDSILSRAIANTLDPNSDSNSAGLGGDVLINSTNGNAQLGKIESYSSADGTLARGSGDVNISAINVEIDGIDASTSADRDAQNGGAININAQASVVVDGELESYTYARSGSNAGQGGNIVVEGNEITSGPIETWSIARDDSGEGGNVTLRQHSEGDGNFVLVNGDIQTYSLANDDDARRGGNVLIDMWKDAASDLETSVTVAGSITTSSRAEDENADNGGDIAIYADSIDIQDINTESSSSRGHSGNAGDIFLYGNSSVSIGSILATSTDQAAGEMLITGDSIALTGSSVNGESIRFRPLTKSRNINIGFDGAADALSLDASELSQIDNRIEFGYTDLSGTGTVTLDESIISTVGSRGSIDILGGNRLIGPDLSTELTYALEGPGEGSIVGADVGFFGIENLQGGTGKDIFNLQSGVDLNSFESIAGGDGENIISYESSAGVPVIADLRETNLSNVKIVGPTVVSGLSGNTLQGEDISNTWAINNPGSGILNGDLEFENFGRIAGGSDRDTLDYSGYATAVSVDIAGSSTGLDSFTGIENIIGSGERSDQLTGSIGNDAFILGENNSVNNIDFSGFERLDGGDGDNTFEVASLTSSDISVIGGNDFDNSLSNNRVVINSATANWKIDSKNQGSIEQAGNILSFEEIQHIENRSAEIGEVEVLFSHPLAQITGSISSGQSNLTLIGDDINIGYANGTGDNQNATVSGSGTLTIRPTSNAINIEIGGNDAYSGQTLNITDGELAAIQEGFIDITFGDDNMTGEISSNGDVSFQDAVSFISQGRIDTTAGTVSLSKGDLTLTTESNVVGQSLTTSGGDVIVRAPDGIFLGDVSTVGDSSSGDIDLTATDGTITTGSLTTSERSGSGGAGDVSLSSARGIQIDIIQAEGRGESSGENRIEINTLGTFEALGSRQGRSLSTLGAGSNEGSIRIMFGDDAAETEGFSVGNRSSFNTTAGAIVSGQTSINTGEFSGSYSQGDIELISRGRTPLEPPPVGQPVVERHLSSVPVLIDLPNAIAIPSETSGENDIFNIVETSLSQEFSQYFGLDETNEKRPIATLRQVQEKLANVERTTNVTPALVYVYFVSDAASEAASTSETETETETTIEDRAESEYEALEVMIITPDHQPVRHRQWDVNRAQVGEVAQQLRRQATSQFSTDTEYLAPAQQLYNWIMAPLEDHLQQHDVQSLGFVMDAGLRTMPIAILHDGEDYLVENYSLGILPTFSLTNFENKDSLAPDFRDFGVLAMGASEFEDQPDLPAVDEEVTLITQQLWKGDVFLNENFVLENLQAQITENDYGIVHLATHATFKANDPDSSYIQMWDEKLGPSELSELGLSEADIGLIILSACNTAMGDRNSEYGFAGFAVSSGAPSALATLWPVSDEGTLGFMSQFYTGLKQSPIRAEALRQAQIRMISGDVGIEYGEVYGPDGETIVTIPELAESGQWDFSHPFYWSAFTMIGNPW